MHMNDRASFSKGRVILVSHAVTKKLGMFRDGTAEVHLNVLNGDGVRPTTYQEGGERSVHGHLQMHRQHHRADRRRIPASLVGGDDVASNCVPLKASCTIGAPQAPGIKAGG